MSNPDDRSRFASGMALNAVAHPKVDQYPTDPRSPGSVTAYDPAPLQDKVRRNIAYWLIAGLLVVIGVYCVVGVVGTPGCAYSDGCFRLEKSYAIVREFLAVALASITGLVGAVTGFYFGAQAAQKV